MMRKAVVLIACSTLSVGVLTGCGAKEIESQQEIVVTQPIVETEPTETIEVPEENFTFGEATLLTATGIDELEGIEIIAARLETSKQERVWAEAFDEHMASYSLSLYNNTPGAAFLFGEEVSQPPFIAIQKTLGDPTTAFLDENNTLTAEYRFENYFCNLSLELIQDGVYKISLTVSSQPAF